MCEAVSLIESFNAIPAEVFTFNQLLEYVRAEWPRGSTLYFRLTEDEREAFGTDSDALEVDPQSGNIHELYIPHAEYTLPAMGRLLYWEQYY